MWYITVCLFLTIFSIAEFSKRKPTTKRLFNVIWFVLTCMLVFRYGQGTDYYEYSMIYNSVDEEGSFFVNALAHGEIGWYILNLIGVKLGMSFELFLGIVSLVEMVFVRIFIQRYSPYMILSLLLLYPTFYLTVCYSTLRQALVLCLFLGVGITLLLEKMTVKYIVLIFFLTLIHSSAVILSILPFLLDWKKNKYYLIVGFLLVIIGTKYVETSIDQDSIKGYIGGSVSIAGILVRVILFLFIWKLYVSCKNELIDRMSIEVLLFRIYFVGFAISIFFFNSATLSQRLTIPLKAVEIVLIPILLYKNRQGIKDKCSKAKRNYILPLFITLLAIMNVEFIKNIYSYIEQGNYYTWVTPLDYPYSSVFDKDEIRKYISHFDGEE